MKQTTDSVINLALERAASGTHKPTESSLQALTPKRRKLLADVWQVLLSRRLVTDPVGSDAHLVFERDMADLSDTEIGKGLACSKDFTGWFSFPAFRELCRMTPADLGLPTAREAMREACNAPYPKDQYQWSHPAVYLAGVAVGWYDMQHKSENELLPIYERAYEQLVRRVMSGDKLSLPVRKALPESVFVPASPEKARSTLNSIKELLG